MAHRFRHPCVKWPLRALFALGTCELTLLLGSGLVERHAGEANARTADSTKAPRDGAIFCIGDSNTQGIGAPADRSYPAQLQELLRAAGDPREVVNLGVAGFSSRMAIERLERELTRSTPSVVLYLAGNNDRTRTPDLLDLPAEPAEPAGSTSTNGPTRVAALLSHLRTWRIARTAWRIARGDVQRGEYGGAAARSRPDPRALEAKEWQNAWRSRDESSFAELSTWLEFFWNVEEPALMREALSELQRSPRRAAIDAILRQPMAVYEWELAGVESGRWGPVPGTIQDPRENRAFVATAHFLADRSGARHPALLDAFLAQEPRERDPWGNAYLALHQGFAVLEQRDWADAATRLDHARRLSESISPRVGWPYSLGGAALAHALALGETRTADGALPPNPAVTVDPALWENVYWTRDLPIGREWMAVAEIVDGARRGLDSPEHRRGRRRARERFAEPRIAPLAWLYAHPLATFAQIAAELPLEPCRAGWWGIRRFLFRNLREEELARISAGEHERLAELARRHGFDIVVLTYLAEDEPEFNAQLRAVAATRGWPLADVRADHAPSELEADDRRRYFSPDRGHPNSEGYALVAGKVFAVLQAQMKRAQ